MQVVGGAHGSDFDNDELRDQSEVDLVSGFLQNAQDWGELFDGLEGGEIVRAKHSLSQNLQELELGGFLVFGASSPRKMRFGNQVDTWNIAVLRVIRNDSLQIVKLGFDKTPEKESPNQAL